MLPALDDEQEAVGETRNGSQAIMFARELRPDVVLMDLLRPVKDGLTASGTIRRVVAARLTSPTDRVDDLNTRSETIDS